MALRILIVPDKFKGTLTAHEAARAMAAGWRRARPGDVLSILPMSDGGDGFGAVLGELLKARVQSIRTVDAAHRPLPAKWHRRADTAIIDSAGIIGLAMLPKGKFHPFQLDSEGLGQVMVAAARHTTEAIIGIGGSATNDGGFGMARALGWKFFDAEWEEILEWWQLPALQTIRPPAHPLNWKVTVAVDVGNPLLGRRGCSRIYGPQKGLRPEDFALAEKGLAQLARVMKKQHGRDCAEIPGAGAAGGLGFGLMAFANAKLESGFALYSKCADLKKQMRRADLVLTGEGRLDHQTAMGKGVGQIARLARASKVPCVGLAGAMEDSSQVQKLFWQTACLTDVVTQAKARGAARASLEKLARKIAASFVFPSSSASR